MAQVVGTISLSHSPLWNLAPDPAPGNPGAAFVAFVEQARQILDSLRPDCMIIFGPDHARGIFYDLLPPFTIGIERVSGVGDYGTPAGELPLHTAVAEAVFEGVTKRGFDPAVSLDMRIDHGLTQVYSRLVPNLDIPIVPIIVNSGCPPLPSFQRCSDFGAAVGEAIAESVGAERIVTLGSGGMSHWPASIDAYDEAISPEWRDFLIHGRPRVDEVEASRVSRARALADSDGVGDVADTWDRDILQRLATKPSALSALDAEDVVGLAGPGACELRAWAAATAAWGGKIEWTAYESVPSWITGMGIVASTKPEVVAAR
ncbi:DODA-type extradiol aromatic ring-opening family dioxygenase [Nocardia sp. R6R-6]|uniref:DODA-type extradiol aromatic ring-opening family dioxygenase n=1 Tax=Nocardia sp. R6R-6 TaxID=3459303 RepID=UPI00403E1563